MSLGVGLRVIVCAMIAMMIASSPALSRTLKVGGTGAATELLRQLAPVFEAQTGIKLDILVGMGTSGANGAVADGKLDLSIAGRDLRDKEKQRGLKVAATYRTPFGVVTSRAGPDNLKRSEVLAIYQVDDPAWPDGMPILIHLRPADESDNLIMEEYFPGMAQALQRLRKRRDLSIAATDQDNLDVAERVKGSLTPTTMVQMLTEKRNLRFVSIDGVPASLENYRNGSYRYGKSLYVIVPSTVSPEAGAFLAFLASPAGQALMQEAGMIAGP
jgi:phosphate transport system substrate-binding protein